MLFWLGFYFWLLCIVGGCDCLSFRLDGIGFDYIIVGCVYVGIVWCKKDDYVCDVDGID